MVVMKLLTDLDSSKISGPDGIPVVIFKNFELKLNFHLY